jgi:hypothetical protein
VAPDGDRVFLVGHLQMVEVVLARERLADERRDEDYGEEHGQTVVAERPHQ